VVCSISSRFDYLLCRVLSSGTAFGFATESNSLCQKERNVESREQFMRLQRTGESRAHLGALLFLEKGERMRQIPIPQSEIMGYVVFLPEVGA
jgi:hypothetical protein